MLNGGMSLNFAQFSYGFPFFGFLGKDCGGPNERREGNQNKNGRHVCQLCGKQGHLVNRCWYRFDPNFQDQTNSNNAQSYGEFSTSTQQYKPSSS